MNFTYGRFSVVVIYLPGRPGFPVAPLPESGDFPVCFSVAPVCDPGRYAGVRCAGCRSLRSRSGSRGADFGGRGAGCRSSRTGVCRDRGHPAAPSRIAVAARPVGPGAAAGVREHSRIELHQFLGIFARNWKRRC